MQNLMTPHLQPAQLRNNQILEKKSTDGCGKPKRLLFSPKLLKFFHGSAPPVRNSLIHEGSSEIAFWNMACRRGTQFS